MAAAGHHRLQRWVFWWLLHARRLHHESIALADFVGRIDQMQFIRIISVIARIQPELGTIVVVAVVVPRQFRLQLKLAGDNGQQVGQTGRFGQHDHLRVVLLVPSTDKDAKFASRRCWCCCGWCYRGAGAGVGGGRRWPPGRRRDEFGSDHDMAKDQSTTQHLTNYRIQNNPRII